MIIFGAALALILLLVGLPIFMVFVMGGSIICLGELQVPMFAISQVMMESVTKYVLLAIPLFVLAANIMLEGGLAHRLVEVFTSLVGHWRGGLAIATVLCMGFFGAISGSILAAIVAIGGILIPMMIKKGYPAGFAATLAGIAAGLNSLIPPSNGAIVFSALTGEPVSRTFAAGILPGLFQMTGLILIAMWMARHMKLEAERKYTWKERGIAFKNGASVLLLPVIILGSIYTGIMSPMEAAAIASLWALLAGALIHRSLTWQKLWNAVRRTAEVTAVIYAIVAGAAFLSVMLSYTQLPQMVTNACLSVGVTPIAFLLMGGVAALILGCFVDALPLMYIMIPIMFPVAQAMHIPMVQLYIVTGAFIGIGLLTPPVCVGVYTAAATARIPPKEVLKYTFPVFAVAMLACAVLYIFLPWFSTWLPDLIVPMGFKG
jgi:C4-dicarboxylate transporter, DctM subunit